MNLPYKTSINLDLLENKELFHSFAHYIYNKWIRTQYLDIIFNDEKFLLFFYNKNNSNSAVDLYSFLSKIEYEKVEEIDQLILFLYFYINLDDENNINKTLIDFHWMNTIYRFNHEAIRKLYFNYRFLKEFNYNNILESYNLLDIIKSKYESKYFDRWVKRISHLDIQNYILNGGNYERLKEICNKLFDGVLSLNSTPYYTDPLSYNL